MFQLTREWHRCAVGTLICVSAAGLATLAFHTFAFKTFVPLLFIIVVVLVALHLGSAAGILGTIGAALVFAEFLFDPIRSIRVSNSAQKDHLILDGHHRNSPLRTSGSKTQAPAE